MSMKDAQKHFGSVFGQHAKNYKKNLSNKLITKKVKQLSKAS